MPTSALPRISVRADVGIGPYGGCVPWASLLFIYKYKTAPSTGRKR